MNEADLYPPLKRFLEERGFEVKGEVRGCDVVAVQGDDVVILELKKTLNLQLVLQGVDRLSMSGTVYLVVPEGLRLVKTQRRRVVRLLRMLGVGLLTVEPQAERVSIVVEPGPYGGPRKSARKTRRLLGEFHTRTGDPTAGGSAMKGKRMTAYRQRAIAIASHLAEHGPTKAAIVAAAIADPKARQVLYSNHYGWFDRLGKGVYGLSERGRAEAAC